MHVCKIDAGCRFAVQRSLGEKAGECTSTLHLRLVCPQSMSRRSRRRITTLQFCSLHVRAGGMQCMQPRCQECTDQSELYTRSETLIVHWACAAQNTKMSSHQVSCHRNATQHLNPQHFPRHSLEQKSKRRIASRFAPSKVRTNPERHARHCDSVATLHAVSEHRRARGDPADSSRERVTTPFVGRANNQHVGASAHVRGTI